MYRHSDKKFLFLTVTLILCTVLAIIVSTGMGYMVIAPGDILRVIGAGVFGDTSWLEGI